MYPDIYPSRCTFTRDTMIFFAQLKLSCSSALARFIAPRRWPGTFSLGRYKNSIADAFGQLITCKIDVDYDVDVDDKHVV